MIIEIMYINMEINATSLNRGNSVKIKIFTTLNIYVENIPEKKPKPPQKISKRKTGIGPKKNEINHKRFKKI